MQVREINFFFFEAWNNGSRSQMFSERLFLSTAMFQTFSKENSMNKMGFKDTHLIKQTVCLPENLQPILKEAYIDEQNFTSKDEVWNAFLYAVQFVLYEEIEQLSKPMNERFIKLVLEYGACISHCCLYKFTIISIQIFLPSYLVLCFYWIQSFHLLDS